MDKKVVDCVQVKFPSRAGQNLNLLHRQPADFSRTISDLQPVAVPVHDRQFRAIARGECALRLVKRPAARRHFR